MVQDSIWMVQHFFTNKLYTEEEFKELAGRLAAGNNPSKETEHI